MGRQFQKAFISIVVLSGLLLAFQNCSKIQISEVEAGGNRNDLSSSSPDNNGGSYEGKIDVYARFATDFTCENTSAPIAYLSLSSSNSSLTFNTRNQCSSSTEAVVDSMVDRSPHQNEIVGYREGIYEFSPIGVPTVIPQRITEIWCRDPVNISIPEVVAKYNSLTDETFVKYYYYNLSSVSVASPEFTVDRQLLNAGTKHSLTNLTEGFTLYAYSDQPSALYSGQFDGVIEITINGQFGQFNVPCRLGGRFDSLR